VQFPASAGTYVSLEANAMRAETQAVVDDIRKSLALLRRHL
jgi:hypothetical protein